MNYSPILFASFFRPLLHQCIEDNELIISKMKWNVYQNNEDFEKWMQKLPKRLSEIGQDLKSLINTDKVFSEDEKLLDNQDLAFLLKVSKRTLQRYRSDGKLPYFMIGHKTYYRVNDVRVFVHTYMDYWASQEFDKKHPKEDEKDE